MQYIFNDLFSSERDPSLHLVHRDSYLTCLPLKLLRTKQSLLQRMILSGKTELKGRGFPMSYDNSDLHAAMRSVNYTYSKAAQRGQSMIPFVFDAPEYVYVLARRSQYLMKKGRLKIIRYSRTHYKQYCFDHKHQNIDLEIAEIVAF